MVKVALLIGVSEYEFTLNPLPAATKDVQVVKEVLQNPEIGGFNEADINTLRNPEPQKMREAMEALFANPSCKEDDLLLLYFSGHGFVDENNGALHLASYSTKRESLKSTAIPAEFIHGLMGASRSKQQVVILDCCYSGAFAQGMLAKGGEVNLMSQLGGQGRAVLTSSSMTEYSFEQKGADLSVYTRYLVEGIQTGAADRDGDGWISIDELHGYTSSKVHETAPAMRPRIYAIEEGYKIIVAKAPVGDPNLQYRKEVERWAQQKRGKLSIVPLKILEEQRKKLNLSFEEADIIRIEVLQPYREFEEKLKEYEKVFIDAIRQELPLSEETSNDLETYQRFLGLREEDIASLKERITSDEAWKSPEAFFNRASNKASQGDNKAAIENYSTAIKLKPDYTDAYYNRGYTQEKLGNKLAAIEDYTQAIQLNPDHVDAYYSRGIARHDSGDKSGAIEDYTQAIKLKPKYYASVYFYRAFTYYRLGKMELAIEDYSQAIKNIDKLSSVTSETISYGFSTPYYGFATAYYNRALAYSKLDKKQEAIEDYTQAIHLKPDYADAYYNRALEYSGLDKKDEAIENYQNAANLYQKSRNIEWYQAALEQIKRLQQKRN